MSWLSKFVFDPIKAAAARASTSTNAQARAVGQAVQDTVAKVAADIAVTPLSANSAAGLAHVAIGDLENGLRMAVDGLAASLLPGPGGAVAGAIADAAFVFAEQHALTYLSSLFSHVRATAAAPVAVAAKPPVSGTTGSTTAPISAGASTFTAPQPAAV